jgi:hypothetical protein
MKTSESIDQIAPAIIAAQGELEPVPMDSENTEVNARRVHKYASFTAMWTACRSVLQKHGLAMIQGGGDNSVPGYITLETTVVHTSGQFISKTLTIPYEKPCPQAAGSAITYAKRYGLGAFFGLVAEVDDDANSAKVPDRKPVVAAKPEKPVTKPPEPAAKPVAKPPEPVEPEKTIEEKQAENFRKATQAVHASLSTIAKDPSNRVEAVKKINSIITYSKGLCDKGQLRAADLQILLDLSSEHVHEDIK